MALFNSSIALTLALPPPTAGSAASLPSCVRNTRSLILTWSDGCTDAGSFEQLFRCRLNPAITLDEMSASTVVSSKPASDLLGAAAKGGSSGGSPSTTLYFTERSGSGLV